MSSTSLVIKDWSAWMPGVSSTQAWQAWADGDLEPQPDEQPDVSSIPPMLRRRLSSLGKMALSVAFPLLKGLDTDTAFVFSSRHGELGRTVGLLNSLADQEPLSPTQFSLSVHNAIAGVLSIATKNTSSITALSADLSSTLLEAVAIMDEQSYQQILCVVYDEPVPEIYASLETSPDRPFAIAFLLTASTLSGIDQPGVSGGQPLSFSICKNPALPASPSAANVVNEPPPLSFLKFLLNPGVKELTLPGVRHSWHWTKADWGVNVSQTQ